MRSPASLFSRGIFASDLKRFWWPSVAYGLFLVFLLPFDHVVKAAHPQGTWAKQVLLNSLNVFSGGNGMQAILICTVPVVVAVRIFSYLHYDRAIAVTHSLPIKRKALFFSHTAAGLVLLSLPIIVTAMMLAAVNVTTQLHEYYSIADIARWMSVTVLLVFLTFSVTVFVGMFTGSMFGHLAFTYIFQMLPSGLALLINDNLTRLVYGYTTAGAPGEFRYNFPLLLFASYPAQRILSPGQAAVYTAAVVLFLAAAWYLYKHRPSESAGEIVVFSVMRPVFKYGVTFCTMLLVGLYFASLYRDSVVLLLAGYVVGSVLGYAVAEILLTKNWQFWTAYKGYVVYVAVISILLAGIAADITGYVHRVPHPEKVKKVYFGYNLNEWTELEVRGSENGSGVKYEKTYFFQDPVNVKNLIALHRYLLEHPGARTGTTRYIAYTLDDGSHVIRRYYIDERRCARFLKPVYESLEYKSKQFPIIIQDINNIRLIEIVDLRVPIKGPAILTEKTDIREFAARLKQDMLNATFEDMISDRETGVYVNVLSLKGKSTEYPLYQEYRSALQWLKAEGYYDNVALLPQEVTRVVVEPMSFRDASSRHGTGSPKSVEITDRGLIEELLTIDGSRGVADEEQLLRATFYGRAKGQAFQFERVIYRDWPFSESLSRYLKQLE